ncbi:DNA mismatch repair protein [Stygiomarasmius scandens]|uniref:DNA mismatch repair protein n=1 Tax=Marasmiellus scandens TaxID=2682957 RepID=A0ABR1JZY4_9AGAR
MAYIERLGNATRAKLRSTQILTSLPQVVSELFQNSLDSGARNIEIGVNCEEWMCWVRDDGHGMSRDDLAALAKSPDDGRYGTSKAYSPDTLNILSTFGFRGEALASAADLCCLEICSRTARARETWSIILKEGQTLYSGPAVRWRRESHGTTVCVRDAFYNLPVRRRAHPSSTRTLELIRQEVEVYALMFPGVSFSLEDTRAKENGSTKYSILRVPKMPSTLNVFRHIYGRALCQNIEEINLACGEMKLEGFISLEGALSKAYQLLYVNRHPISSGDLHRIIDSRFAASSFAKNAFEESGDVPRSSSRRSPRKTEKRPVYVLNLTISAHQVDNLLEPSKSTVHLENKNSVTAFLSSAIQSFLTKHGFSTRAADFPRKRRRTEEFLDDSGYAEYMTEEKNSIRSSGEAVEASLYIRGDERDAIDECNITWTDPTTGETFIVDARTGHSRPQAFRHSDDEVVEELNELRLRGRRTLPRIVENEASQVPSWITEALAANNAYALTEKRIPTLTTGARHNNGEDSCAHHHLQHEHFARAFLSAQGNGESGVLSHRRFSKDDLSNVRVINQVDRKFIACLIDEHPKQSEGSEIGGEECSTSALILIDQHAADERIRVERFLKSLCLGFLRPGGQGEGEVEIRQLTVPKPILLTRHEATRLASSMEIQDAFRKWGFRFSDLAGVAEVISSMTNTEGDSYTQVSVSCIPEVVADKLLLENELRDLVKGYLVQVESDILDISQFRTTHSESKIRDGDDRHGRFEWLKALRWCPRELLDLVNSKACRGAIMFNDSLTKEQCERLVKQLSDTAFPFQCAHGRPSLVPLANIGSHSDGGRVRGSRMKWSALSELKSLD